MEGCHQMEINGRICSYVEFSTPKTRILVLRGEKGLLGCGYLNMSVAARIDEALAVVRGVQSIDDMLSAEVRLVSPAARDLGIKPGMTGLEAMKILA